MTGARRTSAGTSAEEVLPNSTTQDVRGRGGGPGLGEIARSRSPVTEEDVDDVDDDARQRTGARRWAGPLQGRTAARACSCPSRCPPGGASSWAPTCPGARRWAGPLQGRTVARARYNPCRGPGDLRQWPRAADHRKMVLTCLGTSWWIVVGRGVLFSFLFWAAGHVGTRAICGAVSLLALHSGVRPVTPV